MTFEPVNVRIGDLDDLYARIPEVTCRGLCHDQCTVIGASGLERRRVAELGFTVGEPGPTVAAAVTGYWSRCPALGPLNNCRVYTARPTICRLYGVAEGLLCEHGCVPERVMPRGEATRLLAEVEQLSRRCGDGVDM